MFRCDLDRAVFVGIWNSPPDSSIPVLPDGEPLTIIVPIHVDDGLGVTNSPALWEWFIREMRRFVNVVDLGPVSLFLGIHIVRDRPARRLWLSQRSYVANILEQASLLNCRSQDVPLKHPLDNLPPLSPNVLAELSDDDVKTWYLRIVGWLMYLALCTRPDIAYAAAALGQYSSRPTKPLLHAARGVLRYLSGTMDLALQYPTAPTPQLPRSSNASIVRLETCGISDADWATDSTDRKSVSGYTLHYLDCLVSWSAVKQRVVALSSTEAELYALTNLLREAMWFKMFVKSIRLPCPTPFPIFSDNQSTIQMVESDKTYRRSTSLHPGPYQGQDDCRRMASV